MSEQSTRKTRQLSNRFNQKGLTLKTLSSSWASREDMDGTRGAWVSRVLPLDSPSPYPNERVPLWSFPRIMVDPVGFEPTASSLRRKRSATDLRALAVVGRRPLIFLPFSRNDSQNVVDCLSRTAEIRSRVQRGVDVLLREQ